MNEEPNNCVRGTFKTHLYDTGKSYHKTKIILKWFTIVSLILLIITFALTVGISSSAEDQRLVDLKYICRFLIIVPVFCLVGAFIVRFKKYIIGIMIACSILFIVITTAAVMIYQTQSLGSSYLGPRAIVADVSVFIVILICVAVKIYDNRRI